MPSRPPYGFGARVLSGAAQIFLQVCDDLVMAFLEIRRHSHRKEGGGSQLSQRGVDLARKVGNFAGPYSEVVTSVLPRTRETAIAMGYAVDRELVTDLTDEDILAAIEAILPTLTEQEKSVLGGWPTLLSRPGSSDPPTGNREILYRWSQTIAGLWRDLMTPYGNGSERVLFVGHSGHLEAGLVSCLPTFDYDAVGGGFGPMEGALLEFAGEPARFRDAQILRI